MIAGALPGDRVRATLTLPGERRAVRLISGGKIVELITPSPHRCEHPCSHHYEGCPASPLGALDYAAALEWKRRNLAETLRRIGGVESDVPPVIPSPRQWGYRERVDLLLLRTPEGHRLGYAAGQGVAAITTCHLAEEVVRNGLARLAGSLAGLGGKSKVGLPDRGRVVLRADGRGGVIAVVFVSPKEAGRVPAARAWLSAAGLEGWQVRSVQPLEARAQGSALIAEEGRCEITLHAAGFSTTAPPLVFSQVNADAAAVLVECTSAQAHKRQVSSAECNVLSAERVIGPDDRLLDLYGGWGMFALEAARQGIPGVVVDNDVEALRAGSRLAKAAGLDVRFRPGNLDTPVGFSAACDDFTVVLVDPPRHGLSRPALAWLRARGPRRAICVSCHPAALARDLKALPEYRLAGLQPLDMFPQTPDLETVAGLVRKWDSGKVGKCESS